MYTHSDTHTHTHTHPISDKRFHRVLDLLLEPIALQDVDDAHVDDDEVAVHVPLDVALPAPGQRTLLPYASKLQNITIVAGVEKLRDE